MSPQILHCAITYIDLYLKTTCTLNEGLEWRLVLALQIGTHILQRKLQFRKVFSAAIGAVKEKKKLLL